MTDNNQTDSNLNGAPSVAPSAPQAPVKTYFERFDDLERVSIENTNASAFLIDAMTKLKNFQSMTDVSVGNLIELIDGVIELMIKKSVMSKEELDGVIQDNKSRTLKQDIANMVTQKRIEQMDSIASEENMITFAVSNMTKYAFNVVSAFPEQTRKDLIGKKSGDTVQYKFQDANKADKEETLTLGEIYRLAPAPVAAPAAPTEAQDTAGNTTVN